MKNNIFARQKEAEMSDILKENKEYEIIYIDDWRQVMAFFDEYSIQLK